MQTAVGTTLRILVLLAALSRLAVAGPAEEYGRLLAAEDGLLGYWPLAGSVEAAVGELTLEAGREELVAEPGPLGGDQGLRIGDGQFLRMAPSKALDAPEMAVELFVRMRNTVNGSLFGIRDGRPTRFGLHATSDSPTLLLWDGSRVSTFNAHTDLEPGKWYHIALSISATEASLWVDGRLCRPGGSTRPRIDPDAVGFPFVLGATDFESGARERSNIVAAHLAIHGQLLTTEAITARLEAIDWNERRLAHQREEGVQMAELDERVTAIKEQYGVDVFYKYDHETFIPEIWHSVMVGTQIPLTHAEVMLTEIEYFLSVVPEHVIQEHLESIYMFRSLRYGNYGMGGMAYRKSIYLCAGPASHVRHSLFHEFSHVLEGPFPIDREAYMATLPDDYQYRGAAADVDSHGYDEELRSMGFVLNYATKSLGEEVAVLSDYIFARPETTRELMKQYPAIRDRVLLTIARYQAVSPEYDFSDYEEFLNAVD